MTIEVHHGGTGLAVDTGQEYWTERQLAALRQIGVERAGPGDLTVFMHVCQRTGLDPFARQIYMVQRDGKQVIQTGIDGYRLVAQRAARRDGVRYGIGASEWCGEDMDFKPVWLPAYGYPAAARVVVTKDGEPFPGTALWHEYVQTTRDKQTGEMRVTKMWDQRAAGQLAKCAEALALRKAFPQDLAGLYVDAELDRAVSVRGEVVRGGLSTVVQTSGADVAPGETRDSSVEPLPSAPESDSDRARRASFVLFSELAIGERDDQIAFAVDTLGRPIDSRTELEPVEWEQVEARLRRIKQGDPDAEWTPVPPKKGKGATT